MKQTGESCESCTGSEWIPWCVCVDNLTAEPFELVRCTNCGLGRTVLPDAEVDLARYYGESYYGKTGRRFPGWMEACVRWFRRGRARTIERLHPAPGTLLDVGCGRGLMLAGLARSGWICVGTEFSGELDRVTSVQAGVEILLGEVSGCALKGGTFDVVTLWHSLEHLRHPGTELGEIWRILKPGGWVVIEVPNAHSFQAKIGRGRWFHCDAPRHLHHFTSSALRNLLGRTGFEVVREGAFSLEYGPYGFLQTLLNKMTSQSNVLYSRLKGIRTPGSKAAADALDFLLTVVLTPLALLLALPAEVFAAMCGAGGVLRIIARKPPDPTVYGATPPEPPREARS